MVHPGSKIGPPAAHILETELGEEISLYDPTNENVVILNQTAADIWRLSDGEADLDEIVQLLATVYGVEAERIRGEVESVVADFYEQSLLETENG